MRGSQAHTAIAAANELAYSSPAERVPCRPLVIGGRPPMSCPAIPLTMNIYTHLNLADTASAVAALPKI